MFENLLWLAVLMHLTVSPYLFDSSPEVVSFDCIVEGDISSLNASYIDNGSNIDNERIIDWQYKTKLGHAFRKNITPCYNIKAYQCSFTFNCRLLNNNITKVQMNMVMPDIWSEMTFRLHFGNGVPRNLLKKRTECQEHLFTPSNSTTTKTTYGISKIAINDSTENDLSTNNRTIPVNVVIVIAAAAAACAFCVAFVAFVCHLRKRTHKGADVAMQPPIDRHVDGSGACYPFMCCKERLKAEMDQNLLPYNSQLENVVRQLDDPDGHIQQHADHDKHLDDNGMHLDDHNLQIEDIITELDDHYLQIEDINAYIDNHDMQIEDINIQLNNCGMELNENGRLPEGHCKQPVVNGRLLQYNDRHLEHLDSKLENHDKQLEYQDMQLVDYTRKINREKSGNSTTVEKFGTMKIYLPSGTPDAGTWLECDGKLYSDSNLVIDITKGNNIEIFMKGVWSYLQYGEHLCLACDDIPILPPESDISCLLTVPKKPSCKLKPCYILLDSERELKEWVIAIINSIPQMSLQQNLITYYRKECSQLQINPFYDEVGYASKLLEIYISPRLEIRCPKLSKSQSQPKWISSYRDIFLKNETGKEEAYQNIYISSPAGYGKTSFCNRIALAWCHAHLPLKLEDKCFIREDIDVMKKFKFLFFISLRHAHECECYIDIMIQNLLLCNLANSDAYKEFGLKFIQNLLDTEKCLVVLDGLDEWSHPQNSQCNVINHKIPHNRAGSNCTVLTTSRHWKIDDARLKAEETDYMLELNGFTGDMLEKLIGNATQKMNDYYGKEAKATHFMKLLMDKNLTGLSNIPVIVMQLLTLWFDGEPIGKSQCDIFSNMFEFLFKRYFKKNRCEAESEPTNSSSSSKCSQDIQYPVCFMNKVHCKIHMKYLLKIGHLAFDTLFSENQELSTVFDMTVAEKYISDKDLKMSLNVGILAHDKKVGKVSKRQSNVWFLHKTIQEFLAALHLADLAVNVGELTVITKKIMHVCCSIEKTLYMSHLFIFISGLCPQVLSCLCEPLRSVVSADKRTKKYRTSCKLGKTSSEGEILHFFQEAMMECAVESQLNGHKDVHLPVSDVFIIHESPDLSDKFKFLIKVPVYSVFVCHICLPKTTTDIFNSVTQFKSIQKLWLSDISESIVDHLKNRLRYAFKVKSDTWQHLESVTIEIVRGLSYMIMCDLADCIIQLPKSVTVRFEKCFNSQMTPDFRPYIQRHSQIIVDVDKTEHIYDNCITFQFHSIKTS